MPTRTIREVAQRLPVMYSTLRREFPRAGVIVHGLTRRHLNTDAPSPVPAEGSSSLHEKLVLSPTVDWTDPRDVLVRTKTGPGTIAGLESSPHVAGRVRLVFQRRHAGPLILAPTRESAIRIAIDAQRLTTHLKGFEVQLLVGGDGKDQQKKDWTESSRDLVVATPGRLRDLLTNEVEFRQAFKRCPMLILDETDTMLSMGFRDDIDAIVSFLPPPPLRQTLLFSATMSRAVRQLASWILSPSHTLINAMPPGLGSCRNKESIPPTTSVVPCDNDEPSIHGVVEQFYTLCRTASEQIPTLLKLIAHDQLAHGSGSKVIVSCPTVQTADLFEALLCSVAEESVLPVRNTDVVKTHLKMRRSDRYRTRALFRKAGKTPSGRPAVLVTSDAGARGMDYPGVTRMIQIGIPSRENVYIRRIEKIASAVPGRRKENGSKPTVRADLLLLPWEAGFMDWQLTSLPIKPLSISDLDGQLASSLSPQSLPAQVFKPSALAEVVRRCVDPADVRSTAASLLGYYLLLAPPLRLQPRAILAGVSSWASECFDVSIPPVKRFPKKFTEAYERSMLASSKGLFVDGLRLARLSYLGKSKSKNRSVWEGGANTRRRKPRRWY